MDERDATDLNTVATVLGALRPPSTAAAEVLVRDVLAKTTLRMPRVVSLTRRYSAEIAERLGVGHVRYEPSRYMRHVGSTPARIYLGMSVPRE